MGQLAAMSVSAKFAEKVAEVDIGAGFLRREEDDRNVISSHVQDCIGTLRPRKDWRGLLELGLTLTNPMDVSYVITSLCEIEAEGAAQELADRFDGTLSTLAVRQLAHVHAKAGDIKAAL